MYTVTKWLRHMDSDCDNAVSWNSHRFQTVRERKAFEAGFKAGAGDSRRALETYCKFKLEDPPARKTTDSDAS